MLWAPDNSRRPFLSYENGGLKVFSWFVRFLVKNDLNSEKCIEYAK